MKRFFLCVIIWGIATTVWSQELSFGNGIFIGNDFGGGFRNETFVAGDQFIVGMPMHYLGGGGFVFFDTNYTVASFGFFVGGGKEEGSEMETNGYYDGQYSYTGDSISKTMDFSFTSLNLGLLGKYPIKISEKLKIFPLLGFDYLVAFLVTFENEKYDEPKLWNQFWFKLGGGLDCELSKRFYFRIEALYGIRTTTNGEKLFAKNNSRIIQDYHDTNITKDTPLGHGLTVRIAIGYKLKNITE